MNIVVWIVVGLVSGVVGSSVMGEDRASLPRYLLLGIAGAVLGGGLLGALGASTLFDLSPLTIVAALVGAAGVLAVYGVLQRRA